MTLQINEDTQTTEATTILEVTPAAVTKIKALLEERELVDHALRVFVSGGGCSGMQYGMAIEPQAQATDTEIAVDGVRLLVDPQSLPYLHGANIDFIDNLMGGGFRIDNPNATSACGCGNSFKTEDGAASSGGGCSSCG